MLHTYAHQLHAKLSSVSTMASIFGSLAEAARHIRGGSPGAGVLPGQPSNNLSALLKVSAVTSSFPLFVTSSSPLGLPSVPAPGSWSPSTYFIWALTANDFGKDQLIIIY